MTFLAFRRTSLSLAVLASLVHASACIGLFARSLLNSTKPITSAIYLYDEERHWFFGCMKEEVLQKYIALNARLSNLHVLPPAPGLAWFRTIVLHIRRTLTMISNK